MTNSAIDLASRTGERLPITPGIRCGSAFTRHSRLIVSEEDRARENCRLWAVGKHREPVGYQHADSCGPCHCFRHLEQPAAWAFAWQAASSIDDRFIFSEHRVLLRGWQLTASRSSGTGGEVDVSRHSRMSPN